MSEISNVYKTPSANLEPSDAMEAVLADRGTRLLAAIIDGVLGMIISIMIMFVFGVWDMIMNGVQPPISTMLFITALNFLAFMALHGYLLANSGQTIGKRLLKIQIVGLDNKIKSLGSILGLRYLPISVVSVIPVLGSILPLVDVLFIFRQDRRCIHDHIAGTRVVNFRA